MPIDRNGGQYITANPQQPTQSSAPGIWDIDEQGSAQAAGRWPLPPNVVQRSLRFNSADSAYLSRTPATASNRKTWTWSGWVKRSTLGGTILMFGAADGTSQQIEVGFNNDSFYFSAWLSTPVAQRITTAKYRDVSAWYHMMCVLDMTQAVANDRVKLYVNGVQITDFSANTNAAQNTDFPVNNTILHAVGREEFFDNNYFNGYMAEINFVDGQALTPSSFGQTDAQTGQWIPRVYSGSYGTNGFRLQFLDNSGTTATTLGKDTSGMGNNWTPNNFSVAAGSGNDSLRDVPMNYYSPDNGLGGEVIGNYATFNPALPAFSGIITLSNGALDATTGTGGTTGQSTYATFAVNSGKWYWEATFGQSGSSAFEAHIGWATSATDNSNAAYAYLRGGQKVTLGTLAAYGASYVANDVIGVALDMDAGTMTFYKNGVSQGTAFTGLTGTLIPTVRVIREASYTSAWYANFGQRPFAYTAPSGFKALCTQNFSAPRIGNVAVAQANDYFNTVLYNGTGATQSITGVGFQPDLVWVKNRTGTQWHNLTDAVRGTNSQLYSNDAALQGTLTNALTSFDSDGFTVGSAGDWNGSGYSMVGWCWNAGGSTVTNTSGSITSSVRANQTSGFSVVTYTGTSANATVGHGLGVAPNMVICKSRGTAGTNWGVWHSSLTSYAYYLLLNTTAGQATAANAMQALPSSTLLSLGASSIFNDSAAMVAYCFAAVPGFSAFGSYTGNNSTDGTFVYLGFRPAFVMIKQSAGVTTGADWRIFDNVRNTYNPETKILYANLPGAQDDVGAILDFTSNGFKLKSTWNGLNNSGGTFIYAAFAEIPFQFANAR